MPEAPGQQGRSYNTNTFGQNSVGTQITDEQYINSPYYGFDFMHAGDLGYFPIFSSGVIGTQTPEPSSLAMAASGLVAALGIAYRPWRCRG